MPYILCLFTLYYVFNMVSCLYVCITYCYVFIRLAGKIHFTYKIVNVN